MNPRSKHSLALVSLLGALALAPLSLAHAQESLEVVHRRPVHLILGIGVEGGGFVDQASGLMGGAQVHVGIHFFGVEIYGLSQGFIGSLMVGNHQGQVEGISWNSAMLGFGVGVFHLAAGPSLDFAWGCSDSSNGAQCFQGAPLFGIDGRLALQFGSFEVSANVHPTFYGHSTVTGITLGLGWAL